jgi:hypothetical protein
MDKIALAAISFFVLTLFVGIFFISGFSSANNSDKTSLSYVDEESSLKGTLGSAAQNTQLNPQLAQNHQTNQNSPTNQQIPPSPSPTPSPSPVPKPDKPLNLSCGFAPSAATVNQEVSWWASASGGNSTYEYTWSGDDPLGGKTGWSAKVTYTTEGQKNATVKVKSGDQETTCSKSINITSGE